MSLSLADLRLAYCSDQAGVPSGVSLTDAEQAFLTSVVAGLDGSSISDLERAYYIQELSGGGSGPEAPTWGPVVLTGVWSGSGTDFASETVTAIRQGDVVTIEVTAAKTGDAPSNTYFLVEPLAEQFEPLGGSTYFDTNVPLTPQGTIEVTQTSGGNAQLLIYGLGTGGEGTGTLRYVAAPTSVPPN